MMAGPYCKTCKWWYPNVRGGSGECREPSKLIYSRTGNRVNDRPQTHAEDSCQNHKCTKRERINEAYRKSNPRNCPVIEQTGDGVEVGTCTFYLPDGKTCPRHGDVTKYDEKARKE